MSSFSSLPYFDLSFFTHSLNISVMFLFPVTETKGQQYLWEIVFLSHRLEKKSLTFCVEKQGADMAGSVNSCVMSENTQVRA